MLATTLNFRFLFCMCKDCTLAYYSYLNFRTVIFLITLTYNLVTAIIYASLLLNVKMDLYVNFYTFQLYLFWSDIVLFWEKGVTDKFCFNIVHLQIEQKIMIPGIEIISYYSKI